MHCWKIPAGISTPGPGDVVADVSLGQSRTLADKIGLDMGVPDGTVTDESSLLETSPLDGVSLKKSKVERPSSGVSTTMGSSGKLKN